MTKKRSVNGVSESELRTLVFNLLTSRPDLVTAPGLVEELVKGRAWLLHDKRPLLSIAENMLASS